MAATYEPIATTTVAVAASSITFSSIPSTYTDLRLIVVPTSATNENFALRFNSDSGTNYSSTRLVGNGSAVSSANFANTTEIQLTSSFYINATPTLHTFDIFSYAGSTYKTFLFDEISDMNGSGGINKQVGLWRSTSAINNIYLFSQGVNLFAIGTTATLYGIKAA